MEYRNKQTGERVIGSQLGDSIMRVTYKDGYIKDWDIVPFLRQYEPVMYIFPNNDCDGLDCGERHKKPHKRENCCDDITTTCKASCVPVEKEPQKIGGWHLCKECRKPVTNGKECSCIQDPKKDKLTESFEQMMEENYNVKFVDVLGEIGKEPQIKCTITQQVQKVGDKLFMGDIKYSESKEPAPMSISQKKRL